jgi:hypothetical protein
MLERDFGWLRQFDVTAATERRRNNFRINENIFFRVTLLRRCDRLQDVFELVVGREDGPDGPVVAVLKERVGLELDRVAVVVPRRDAFDGRKSLPVNVARLHHSNRQN